MCLVSSASLASSVDICACSWQGNHLIQLGSLDEKLKANWHIYWAYFMAVSLAADRGLLGDSGLLCFHSTEAMKENLAPNLMC